MANKVGKPSLFTTERIASLIDDVAHGVPYIITAEANGISDRIFYQWLQEGRLDILNGIDSDKAKFAQSIKKAERDKLRHHVQEVADKPERWQADAWLLERKWWKHFSSSAPLLELNERLEKMERDSQGAKNETDSSEKKEDTEV